MRQKNFIPSKGPVAGATANLFQIMNFTAAKKWLIKDTDELWSPQWGASSSRGQSFSILNLYTEIAPSATQKCKGVLGLMTSQLEQDEH